MNVMTLPAPAVNPPKLITADEFARLHANHNVELVKGHILELSMPSLKHGMICNNAAYYVTTHVRTGDLGRVMTNDSWIKTREGPDSVRGVDVCFFSYDRLPRGPVPEGFLPLAPDLAVEVRSPSDRWTVVFAKVVEYLERRCSRAVVVLDPGTATASVYRPDELQQIFDNGDELTLPDVLPGFAVPVKRFFE